MNKIVFPLKQQMKGAKVGWLHQALEGLGIKVAPAEKEGRLFGASTRAAVQEFQADHHLKATGVVNEATANLLNQLVAGMAAPGKAPA